MAKSTNPFHYFDSSPELIRLVVMMHVKYPLSLRNAEAELQTTVPSTTGPEPPMG